MNQQPAFLQAATAPPTTGAKHYRSLFYQLVLQNKLNSGAVFKEFASLPLRHTSTVLTYSIFTKQTVGPQKATTYCRSSSKDITGCVLAPGQWCTSASYKGKPFKQRLRKDTKMQRSGDVNYTWHSNTLGGLKKSYTIYPAITEAGLESLVKTYHQFVRK